MYPDFRNIVDSFAPIGLDEMDNVRLMDRIDTKYVFQLTRVIDLLEAMREKYRVLEVNGRRISSYNTTYLDTPDCLFFNQHVTGRPERSKVRYRKYESTGITFLEVKKKTKKLRTVKWRTENILLDHKCDERAIKFINKHIICCSELLRPVISNSFRRITLVGTEIPERITLDFDLSFAGTEEQKSGLPMIAIAELKSDGPAVRSPFSALARTLSIKPAGFSKYCVGSAILYDYPRKNMLKPTLLLINKIENECHKSISA